MAEGEDRYAGVVHRLLERLPELAGVSRIAELPEPSWDNDYWGGVDAAVHMVELLDRNPATYLEIGSGYSTVLARHAISAHGLRTRIVSIDPLPRAEVDGLCDVAIRRPLEQVGSGVAEDLEPGDVVVIDGSHVALMGTDATVALLELVPRIPPGVLVGIDDVFLPWDYHPTWAGRYYSEQYVLAGFLLGGAGGWQITFPGLYVAMLSPLASRLEPLWKIVETHFGRVAGSIWMERASTGARGP